MARRSSTAQNTTAQDQAQSFMDRGWMDPNVLTKDGLLNPDIWDGTPNEDLPWTAQGERVQASVAEVLNKNQPHLAPWRVGLLVEEDLPQAVAKNWVVLQHGLTLKWQWWSDQVRRRLGLVIYEGAICWPGRGGVDEPHFVVIKPERDHQAREQQKQKRMEDLISPPDLEGTVGVRRVADVKVNEKQHQVPMEKVAQFLNDTTDAPDAPDYEEE